MAATRLSCPICQAMHAYDDARERAPEVCRACGKPLGGASRTASEGQWFYHHNKQKLGPVSWSRLKELIECGQLQGSAMVLQAGTQKWLAAASVPTLVAAPEERKVETKVPPVKAEPSASLPRELEQLKQELAARTRERDEARQQRQDPGEIQRELAALRQQLQKQLGARDEGDTPRELAALRQLLQKQHAARDEGASIKHLVADLEKEQIALRTELEAERTLRAKKLAEMTSAIEGRLQHAIQSMTALDARLQEVIGEVGQLRQETRQGQEALGAVEKEQQRLFGALEDDRRRRLEMMAELQVNLTQSVQEMSETLADAVRQENRKLQQLIEQLVESEPAEDEAADEADAADEAPEQDGRFPAVETMPAHEIAAAVDELRAAQEAAPYVGDFLSADVELVEEESLALPPSRTPPPARGGEPEPEEYDDDEYAEQRGAPRRTGNPISVKIITADDDEEALQGWVIDRSATGLRLLVDQKLPEGSVVKVRSSKVVNASRWVNVEIRHCRAQKGSWCMGCQFVQAVSWEELQQFG